MSLQVMGRCPERFGGLLDAFVSEFKTGDELGASFTLAIDGEIVADMRAGFADRARTRPFRRDTLAPLFSITKIITALMIARLVDQGKLTYTQTVASIWPEFAQAGKGAITVDQVLSHQAGLSGLDKPIARALWYDAPAICERLAAMAPLWPVGSASGYHAQTYGYLVGEIFRRVDGRSLGTAMREDLAVPLGLDLWIGLPDAEHRRCAEVVFWPEPFEPASDHPAVEFALRAKWASPGGQGIGTWRRGEFPASNGLSNGPALARLLGALASGGSLAGVHVLSPEVMDLMREERIVGRDLVLPDTVSWGAGVMRNAPNMHFGPSPDAFGHVAWGGCVAFADPARGVSGAYLLNRHGPNAIGDDRATRLVAAAYDCL
jgi:CubicO group peptidase (beta-lactamase class C family)